MSVDAWQVFLDGLDPARLERERFPSIEKVRRESFYLEEHHRQMVLHEQDKADWFRLRGHERVEAAKADVEAFMLAQSRRERAEQAWREQLAEKQRRSVAYLKNRKAA